MLRTHLLSYVGKEHVASSSVVKYLAAHSPTFESLHLFITKLILLRYCTVGNFGNAESSSEIFSRLAMSFFSSALSTQPCLNHGGSVPRRSGKNLKCVSSLFGLSRYLLATLALLLPSQSVATRHTFVTERDGRFLIGPIGIPYGFLKDGVYNLTAFNFKLTVGSKRFGKNKLPDEAVNKNDAKIANVEAGFILKRFDSESDFARQYDTIMDNPSSCSYEHFRTKVDDTVDENDTLGETDDQFEAISSTDDAAGNGIFLSMKDKSKTWGPQTPSVQHTFLKDEEGLYFLVYQVCPIGNNTRTNGFSEIRSSFELDLAYHNIDRLGGVSYLTAGEMPLPYMFLYFSVSYALCVGIWISNIRKTNSGVDEVVSPRMSEDRAVVLPIHHMMTALITLKFLTIFFESVRYHYIRVFGHAEAWSVVYYTFASLKGMFLFTVILLIGSGWSFVKPFLNDKEKKVIFLVLMLQVVDNIAVVVLSHETEGERLYNDWSAVLHLVDIICCCAVLVPIVWSVNNLEKSLESKNRCSPDEEESGAPGEPTGESQKTLTKLKLFRSFYLLVIAYIYFTRIVVFLFATVLGYRHTWIRYFVTELGTLAFYAVIGVKFCPMVENPYFAVKRDDHENAGKVGTGKEMEMRTMDGDTI